MADFDYDLFVSHASEDKETFVRPLVEALEAEHLSFWYDESELDRRLRFRDRLRTAPGLAAEYAALKRTLAERYGEDREAYTEAKGEFVKCRAIDSCPPNP